MKVATPKHHMKLQSSIQTSVVKAWRVVTTKLTYPQPDQSKETQHDQFALAPTRATGEQQGLAQAPESDGPASEQQEQQADDSGAAAMGLHAFSLELVSAIGSMVPWAVCVRYTGQACTGPMVIATSMVCPATMAVHLLQASCLLHRPGLETGWSDMHRMVDTYHHIANIFITHALSGNLAIVVVVALVNLYPIQIMWGLSSRRPFRRGKTMLACYLLTTTMFLVHMDSRHVLQMGVALSCLIAAALATRFSDTVLHGWGDVAAYLLAALYVDRATTTVSAHCLE